MFTKLKLGTLIFLIAVSIAVVFVTPFLKVVDVYNTPKEELKSVNCGWPISFMAQDLSNYDPPSSYKLRCSPISLERPTEYKWGYFGVDVVVLFFVFFVISRACYKLRL